MSGDFALSDLLKECGPRVMSAIQEVPKWNGVHTLNFTRGFKMVWFESTLIFTYTHTQKVFTFK